MTCYVRKLKLWKPDGTEQEGLAVCPSTGPRDTRVLRKAAFEWITSREVRARQVRGGDIRMWGVNVALSIATGPTAALKAYVAGRLGLLAVRPVLPAARPEEPRWMQMLDEALGVGE